MPICGIATEHGHPRLRRVLESRPFSIRKSNRDRRRAGYGVATALAEIGGTRIRGHISMTLLMIVLLALRTLSNPISVASRHTSE